MPSTRRLALAPRLLAPLALAACGLSFPPAHAEGSGSPAYTVYNVGLSAAGVALAAVGYSRRPRRISR